MTQDIHTKDLFQSIKDKIKDGTWIKPENPVTLDVPGDISNEDIQAAHDSGIHLRINIFGDEGI